MTSDNSISPSTEQVDGRGHGPPRTYLQGVLILLSVVLLWVASNFVTQNIFDDGYQKPFFVTYLSVSGFSVYLIPLFIQRTVANPSLQSPYQSLPTSEHTPFIPKSRPPLTHRETANVAKIFCALWFFASWSLNSSLQYTSVASCSIIASMSGFTTLIVGRIFNVETFSLIRFGAVIASFVGVALVSLSDSKISPFADTRTLSTALINDRKPLLGDFLAFLSTVFYAFYVTLLKVRIGDESRINMRLFFGYVGIYNLITLWILGVVLHLTGIESFELPHTSRQWGAIITNTSINILSDFLYVVALLKTTPLVVTVGLSLTGPFALLGDLIFTKINAGAQATFGSLVIVSSFAILGIEDGGKERRRMENFVNVEDSA